MLLTAASELDRLRVVLVAPRNPLNIGAAARAMSNFGFRHLRLVNPYRVAFREARSAVGASTLLNRAKEYEIVSDAVADCTLVVGTTAVRSRDLRHPLRHLEQGAPMIRRHLGSSGAVALLFGSEKFGLSNDDMSHCHWLMRIPTCQDNISMNLGHAVAVCLYELVRGKTAAALTENRKPAKERERERVTLLLLEALRTSGYINPSASARAEEKARRLVHRLDLSAADASVLLGMLRQMVWRLQGRTGPREV